MRRKNLLVLLLLSVTILVIAFVRYIIKQDNNETLNYRLGAYSEFIDIQHGFITALLDQTADQYFDAIKTDISYSQGLHNNNIDFNSLINNTVEKQLAVLSQKTSVAIKPSVRFLHNNFSFSNEEVTKGFVIENEVPYYSIRYPIENTKENKNGIVEVIFNFDNIKSVIEGFVKKSNIGLIYVPDSTILISNISASSDSVINNNKRNSFWHYGFGNSHSLFFDKKTYKKLSGFLSSTSEVLPNFSILHSSPRSFDIATLKKLEMSKMKGSLFLVSINNDFVLKKTKELNSAILIVNVIIVIVGMFGITYLFLNRLNIIKQKQSIQKSEQKLKEMNKSKDKFFSIVAHDLKNPFNGIMGMSAYLCADYDNIDDIERKEIINDINISSKNAFNLLQNLLEWNRAQSGVIKNNPSVLDPLSTIELALETVSNLAKNKDIVIKISINSKSKGWADENLIATVIRNLSTNAVKFSPRNSLVEIIVKEYKNELVFCVSDKGVGLQDNEVDKLFRIDVTLHRLGTENETGTGLGLKICKEFVEKCNGRIWVVSQPNSGCSFYFTIPKYLTS